MRRRIRRRRRSRRRSRSSRRRSSFQCMKCCVVKWTGSTKIRAPPRVWKRPVQKLPFSCPSPGGLLPVHRLQVAGLAIPHLTIPT